MATPTTIAAYIAQAQATGVTYAQLESSLAYMAISAITDGSGRVTATGSDGTSISFTSMDALFTAIAMCKRLALMDAGARILAPEFAPAGSSGSSNGWSS